MDNWFADEILVYEQLREARAKAARSLAAVLISLGERLAQRQERRV